MRLGLEVNFLFLDRRGLGHSTLHWARETARLVRERGDEVMFLTGPLLFSPSLPRKESLNLHLPKDLGPVIRVEEFREIAALDLDVLHLQDLITPYRLTAMGWEGEGGSEKGGKGPKSVFLPRTKSFPRLVVTVHDLIPLLFPAQTPEPLRRRWEEMLRFLPRADAVVAVSRTTARDLARALRERGQSLKELRVIPQGVDLGRFRPHRPEKDIALFRNRHRLPPRYILYVSGGDFRKNHPLLLEAFVRFLRFCPESAGWYLVLAGPGIEVYRSLVEGTPWEGRILFLGFFPEEEVPLLYAAASLFAFPSLYEGFGLPLLEAMASGVPVVASRAGALPELAGDAALLLPPGDPQTWAETFCLLAQHEEERLLWREKGLRRAALFTWQRTAEGHHRLYRDLLRQPVQNRGPGKGEEG